MCARASKRLVASSLTRTAYVHLVIQHRIEYFYRLKEERRERKRDRQRKNACAREQARKKPADKQPTILSFNPSSVPQHCLYYRCDCNRDAIYLDIATDIFYLTIPLCIWIISKTTTESELSSRTTSRLSFSLFFPRTLPGKSEYVVAWSREVKCSNEVAMIEWPVLVYRVDTSISTSTSNAVPAVADRFEALPLRAMHPDYCERVRDRVERPRKTVLPGPISWWDPRCRSANATWKCKTSNRRRFFYSTLFFLFFLFLFPLFLSSSSNRNSDREDENKEWM